MVAILSQPQSLPEGSSGLWAGLGWSRLASIRNLSKLIWRSLSLSRSCSRSLSKRSRSIRSRMWRSFSTRSRSCLSRSNRSLSSLSRRSRSRSLSNSRSLSFRSASVCSLRISSSDLDLKNYMKPFFFIMQFSINFTTLQNHVYSPYHERKPILRDHKKWSLDTGFIVTKRSLKITYLHNSPHLPHLPI